MSRNLPQLKIDAKNAGWLWPISHPNDERALLDGCYPDFAAAERVRRFFRQALALPKEGGGTSPFFLLDWWYRDVIAPLFGWKRKDGRRRYQKAFITTAKKSGKSTVLAGLPMYMLLADGEEEAEVYSTAVDRDQASIVFRKTLRSVRLSSHLSKVLRVLESQKRILHDPTGGVYEALSSDADSTEGKNPHLLIADEIHVWRDRQFFNSLMYGDIVRTQPLFLMITTAGDDDQSVGYEEYQSAKALLNPDDPYYVQSQFAYIAEAEDANAWDKPASWLQAQPSLRGEVDHCRVKDADEPATVVLGSLDKLQAKADEAKQSPRKQRQFVRYICNRWVTEVEDTWLDPEMWDACGGTMPDDGDTRRWFALDLSTRRDLTALCIGRESDDLIGLEWKFWTPLEGLRKRELEWRVPLRDWVEAGHVIACPGPTIDYSRVRATIRDLALECDLQALAYDPWNGQDICKLQLGEEDGLPIDAHQQGYVSMNGPSKQFEDSIRAGRIRHGGNPVARWQARHVVVQTDAAGNIKPNKEKSRQKIDGIVAAVMVVGKIMGTASVSWAREEIGL